VSCQDVIPNQTSPAVPEIVAGTARLPFGIESKHKIISVADDNYVALRDFLAPGLDPQIEDIMQVHVGEQRRNHAPYTKGNFQFERTVVGWRERYTLLDLRRK
jgi:hypothetical protein